MSHHTLPQLITQSFFMFFSFIVINVVGSRGVNYTSRHNTEWQKVITYQHMDIIRCSRMSVIFCKISADINYYKIHGLVDLVIVDNVISMAAVKSLIELPGCLYTAPKYS